MDESKSGFYQCKLFNSEAGPYFIELINDSKELIIDVSRSKMNSIFLLSRLPTILGYQNLVIETTMNN